MKRICWVLLLTLLPIGLTAQTPDPSTQQRALTDDRVLGKVTEVGKDSVTVTPLGGNDPAVDAKTPVTIKITGTTRISKQREPIKLHDIKPGDSVFVVGHREGDTVQAAILGVVPPEMAAKINSGQGGGRRMAFGQGGQFDPADMGKKYILGTVKAINETKLTIARTDGQTQDIEVDENTSFRKSRDSITLPDIKVGDFVMARGEIKNNVFVPKTLNVGPPQAQFQRGAAAAGEGQSGETKPKDTPPQNMHPQN